MVRVLGSSTMLGSMLSRECVWGFSLSQIFKKKKKMKDKKHMTISRDAEKAFDKI